MASSMRSVMTHQFSQVPAAEIQRSSFDRSHGHKTTFNGGHLVPVYVDEALPGDTFNLSMSAFARLATPIHPVMDNLFMESFFFAVPNRLLWDNWEKFNGAQDNPGDSTDFLVPTWTSGGGLSQGGVHDHMGIPTGIPGITGNALHTRAYNLIWNEWFRDQNMQDALPFFTNDGPDNVGDTLIQRRGKRHDYFTSCLPWPQKGDPVGLDLGVTAPITGIGITDVVNPIAGGDIIKESDGTIRTYDFEWPAASLEAEFHIEATESGGSSLPKIFANMSEATVLTINQLREAFQVQRLLERDARGGTRYTEIIQAHFGVTSPDSRLQRPEYLGGGSSPVIISPVAQTSATDPAGPDASPQANLAAIGTASLRNHGFTQSFTEHCVIIGLVSVRADLTYQQGLNRMWSRQTRFDFYWPALANLGEQAVLNKEIFAQGDAGGATDDEVFGYQERYAEYRYKPSLITSKFRSTDAESLDVWHLSEEFSELPTLNNVFISDNPPIDRVIAVQDEPHFLFDSYFKLRCARPMPLYGVPGLIDHF